MECEPWSLPHVKLEDKMRGEDGISYARNKNNSKKLTVEDLLSGRTKVQASRRHLHKSQKEGTSPAGAQDGGTWRYSV